MSEREVHPSVAQRIVIKFLTNEGVKPAEIRDRLRAQFGENTLSWPRVKAWCAEFKKGREKVENLSHRRRPRSSTTPGNAAIVREIIERDRRVTVAEISKETGISVGSVHTIIRDHLAFRKISARWVPRLLTQEHKNARVEVCQTLLARFQNEGQAFLQRIVTCDETWVHHYTPESKRASMEWREKGEPGPSKAKTRLSAGRVMSTVFWDSQGVLLVDFLHDRRTINAAYYCDLLDQVRAAYRSKRRRQRIRDVLLLHDNARPHTAALTTQKLSEMHWTTLAHPPYSPDLSPCDFYMFGPLKEALGGEHFVNDQQVEQFVRNWLDTRPKSFFENGINKLPVRWEKCINKEGNYVEK